MWYNMRMTLTVVSIGILFTALVSLTVSATAFALTIFLWRRWERLDSAMRAYTWFWWFTVLVWGGSFFRYLFISLGYFGVGIKLLDSIVQTAVFFTGPSLFYYVSIRVFNSERVAKITSSISVLLGIVAIYYIFQPNGIPIRDVTYFSAEGTINQTSFIIFSIEAASILVLLFYDMVRRLNEWRRGNRPALYHALYSGSVVLYLVLGSIDESKIITDWPLTVFRMLYAGSFLLVYLIITQDEASQETYLLTRDWGSPNALA